MAMKLAAYEGHRAGRIPSPDVLQLQVIERPVVDHNRVLVRDPCGFGERRRLAPDAKALARISSGPAGNEERPGKHGELGIFPTNP